MADNKIDWDKIDKEKIKLFFTMLGEVVSMIIGLFTAFKVTTTKNDKAAFKNA